MSEDEKSLCRWCNLQSNAIVKEYEQGRLIWVGCADCYEKKERLKKDVKP